MFTDRALGFEVLIGNGSTASSLRPGPAGKLGFAASGRTLFHLATRMLFCRSKLWTRGYDAAAAAVAYAIHIPAAAFENCESRDRICTSLCTSISRVPGNDVGVAF